MHQKYKFSEVPKRKQVRFVINTTQRKTIRRELFKEEPGIFASATDKKIMADFHRAEARRNEDLSNQLGALQLTE